MSARLVLATHNPGKVREFVQILRAEPLLANLPEDAVVSAADLVLPAPVETGVTFEENALLKAQAMCAATGLPAVADDSGLAVDVLGGAPGVFSARWCGRHGDDQANLELLLAQLRDVADHRGAAFVCCAALVTPNGARHLSRGVLRGHLTHQPRGTGGFGYDPIFVPAALPTHLDDGDLTTAQLPPEVKNQISHRGKALRALVPRIAAALTEEEEN